MLIACGVDIVSVRRVEELLKRYGERFTRKVFPEGLDYCYKRRKGELPGCIAARFALKEAVIKALSQVGKKVNFRDISIKGGGRSLKLEVKGCENFNFLYSISHEREFAVAVVNVLKAEKN